MATAKIYDQYEDPGMAFTEEEVSTYSLEEECERHISRLLEVYHVAKAYSTVNTLGSLTATSICKDLARDMADRAQMFTAAVTIPFVDESDFKVTDPEFNLAAQQIESLPEWLLGLTTEWNALIRRAVTLGRRAGLSRADKSRSNKMINAFVNEQFRLVKYKNKAVSLKSLND